MTAINSIHTVHAPPQRYALPSAALYNAWMSSRHCVSLTRTTRRSYETKPFTSPSTSVVCVQTAPLHA